MINTKKINLLYILFFALILASLIQGYYCKYEKTDICYTFFKNYWEENGFIENFQTIFVLTSIIILIKIKFQFKKNNFFHLFFIFKILALIYYLGEEVSWGQNFFKWNTPSLFNEINNQKETNIHNISNLFDQLPRSLVFIWCGFSFIIFLYLDLKLKIKREFLILILPNKKLIYISILLIFLSLPDQFIDILNLHPGHVDQFGKDIPESVFYDKISFNFVRLSELHELIFSFYFLSYSIFILEIKEKIRMN